MKIIQADISHVAALVQVDHSRLFSAHWSETQWRDECTNRICCVWAAFVGKLLVGFICTRGAAGIYEITNLAVAQVYARQGIATALLRQVIQTLQMQDAKQVTLEVSEKNMPARELYKQAGFVTLGVRKQFYQDGADALIMGKNL